MSAKIYVDENGNAHCLRCCSDEITEPYGLCSTCKELTLKAEEESKGRLVNRFQISWKRLGVCKVGALTPAGKRLRALLHSILGRESKLGQNKKELWFRYETPPDEVSLYAAQDLVKEHGFEPSRVRLGPGKKKRYRSDGTPIDFPWDGKPWATLFFNDFGTNY